MKFLILLALLAVGCSKTNSPTKSVEITDDVIQFESLTINTSTAGVIPSSALDFASLAFQQSATQSLIISNKSSSALVIAAEDISSSMLPPFTITKNTCIGTIASRKSCVIDFKLSNSASLSSEQIISSSFIVKGATISLTGTLEAVPAPSTAPDVSLSVSPSSLQFGTLIDGQTSSLSVIIKNNATVAKTTALAIISSQKVAISSNTCPASLGSRKTCTIKFKYTAAGNETVSEQSLTSISNIPVLYSVIVDNPTIPTPVTVTTVEPLNLPASISLTQPNIVSGSVIFKNNGISTFEGPVNAVSSDPSITISSISCLAGLSRGRSCTVNYSVNSLLAPLGSSSQSIRINAKTTALSSAFVLDFNISAAGPAVACDSLTDLELQSYGYTTDYIATVSGNTPNCIIETCDRFYERAGGQEAKSCNAKMCSGLDSQELIDMGYIDDASGSIGYNPQEHLSGSYPACSLTCPSGYETNPNNILRCQPVADVITYQPAYDDYGACSVTQACQGVGEKSRSYTCQKYVNGILESTELNSACQFVVSELTISCQSPMGQISVAVDQGSKQVSCLEGSTIQSYVASSLDCNLGYVANESLQLCEEEIVVPSAVSLIGQMEGNVSGNSFFKIDENYSISELVTNINQKTRSSSLTNLSFYGNDLIYIMGTDAHGTEVYRLNSGSTTPQMITYNPAALGSFSSANSPLVIHGGFAYFNSRLPSDSSLKCVAVDLTNYSNTTFFQSSCNSLTIANGALYGYMIFNASTGAELVRINGGTLQLVSDINPGASNSSINHMVAVGNDLYFVAKNPTVANTPASGLEIFRYNTVTSQLSTFDTIPGATGAVILGLQVYNGNLFYREGTAIKRYNTLNSQVTTITTGSHGQQLNSSTFLGFGDSVYFASSATSGAGTEMIRHIIATGVSSVVDLTAGSAGTNPAQIKTDGTNVYVRSTQKIFKYTISNSQSQLLDLSSPSFGAISFVGAFEVDANNLYYIASQSDSQGFGNEFFKYSISTGTKTIINICEDSQGACQGASGQTQDIKINNNDIYIVGGNKLTGNTEIVKINNLDNSFEIIDSNKFKVGVRDNETSYPVEHIVSDGKIFFSGENNNGFGRLYVKDIGSSNDAVEISLPTPYLDNNPMNFYASQNYIYFGAQIAQTEQKLFQYNKLNGNVVAVEFPFNQSARANYLTAFDNGKYYMSVDQKHIYVFDEATGIVSPLVTSVPYDSNLDPEFNFSAWQSINCPTDPGGEPGLEDCDPPGAGLMDLNNSTNPVIFNGVLYFTGTIYGWDVYADAIAFRGYGLYKLNQDNSVSLLTPQYDSMNPGMRYNPVEPIKTENHIIWGSSDFRQEIFHVYKNESGNSVEETIQFMETITGYPSYETFGTEDSQKNLYFTDSRSSQSLYKLGYGPMNSAQPFAGPTSFGIQQLIQNEGLAAGADINSSLDIGGDYMLVQYGNQLLKCLTTDTSCSVVVTPPLATGYFVGKLYKLGNSVIFSREESDAVTHYGPLERKLYRLNLDDNSLSEIQFSGQGLKINQDLIEFLE